MILSILKVNEPACLVHLYSSGIKTNRIGLACNIKSSDNLLLFIPRSRRTACHVDSYTHKECDEYDTDDYEYFTIFIHAGFLKIMII